MSIGFEKAYLMQTSMNLPTSEIIATYVYKVGLQSGDYAYSARLVYSIPSSMSFCS